MGTLTVDHLRTGYDSVDISRDLTYQFVPGKITSIIGPNGCGKTTFLKTLARILPSKGGEVLLNQQALTTYTSKEIAQQLAILSQVSESQIDLTVFDLVSFGRFPYQTGFRSLSANDQAQIQWALAITGLTAFARQSVAVLSGGQRQRVWIAMALVQDTEILLLDEPTTFLDPAHQLDILNVLKMINQEQQKTIVMTIHDINLASRFSDYIVAMKDGEIVADGTPETIITKEWLRKVFAIDSEIVLHPKTQRPLVLSYEVSEALFS